MRLSGRSVLFVCLFAVAVVPAAKAEVAPPVADAVVDLRTAEGAALVGAEWRFHSADVVAVEHQGPGPDLKPSGPPNRTHDLAPKKSSPDFEQGWEPIAPTSLEARRGTGRLAGGWYRLAFTVPEHLDNVPTAGSTLVFEVVVDDYAEIWVNGRLPQVLGSKGGQLVAGWNAPNRVTLTAAARPGERFDLALFAINGPLSEPPGNYVWVRSATLDLYRPGRASGFVEVPLEVVRLTPGADRIVPRDARLERVASGFTFTEGPVWVPEGYLLFSDPNRNVIYRFLPDGEVSIYRTKSGYGGVDIGEYGQPGSNGLTLDAEGRLTIAEHGNRRITRLEKNGVLTVLADRYQGKRLNSPNDLIYRSDGALFFSDPPFGLPRFHDDPRREQPHFGVYCLDNGRLELISTELTGPNGLGFSPDERYLYVTNWDEKKKVVMRYQLGPGCSLVDRKVFFDMTGAPGAEALDGLEVDVEGNLYVSGPGGLWILSPEGEHLATLVGPELAANFEWGDADGKTLYWTARTGLYRVRLNLPGSRARSRKEN